MKNLRNKVQLIGNLGMDPEVKDLGNGKKVVNFRMATTDYYRDKAGNRVNETQWHNIVVWNGLANIAATYLKKGSEVAIEGKLVHRSFEGKDGAKHYITEIIADDLVMLRKPEGSKE